MDAIDVWTLRTVGGGFIVNVILILLFVAFAFAVLSSILGIMSAFYLYSCSRLDYIDRTIALAELTLFDPRGMIFSSFTLMGDLASREFCDHPDVSN